jgi:hypothetical protein
MPLRHDAPGLMVEACWTSQLDSACTHTDVVAAQLQLDLRPIADSETGAQRSPARVPAGYVRHGPGLILSDHFQARLLYVVDVSLS